MRYLLVLFLLVIFTSISIKGQKVNLDSGLVACYPFNGNANDESGNGNDGIVVGATLTTDRFGKPNSAYSFNGSTNYIYATDNPAFHSKSITLTGWFYPYGEITRLQHIFSKVLDKGTWESYCILLTNYDFVNSSMSDNSGYGNMLSKQMSSVTNTWNFTVYTYDGTTKMNYLYLNGKLVASGPQTKILTYDNHPFQIGAEYENEIMDYFFYGKLDDVRVYNRAINNAEVLALYNGNISCKNCVNPVILDTILNQTICQDNDITYTAKATGTELSYQWIKGGVNITGATDSTYTINSSKGSDNGLYSCTIINKCDTVQLPSFTLTIANIVAINPAFHNQSQCIGDSVGFTLNPTAGTGPYSYQWLKDGAPVTNGNGRTNSLYYNNHISGNDNGKYSCVISNTCNSVTGNVVSLTPIICNRTHHKISGYVTYDNKSKTPMSSKTASTTTYVFLYNSGDTLITTTQTDDNGYYEFVDIINGSYNISGSTNKPWGGSNPTDALIVNRDYIGMYHFTDSLLWHAGDVDSNKRLNPTDALIINRRYIGVLTKYPKYGNWKFQKIKVEMAGLDLKTQDITAVCSGDVNASYTPSARITSTPVSNSGILNIVPGKPFDIPVYLNDNEELGAIGLKFKVLSLSRFSRDSKSKIIGIRSDIEGLIYNITDDGVNLAWSATDEGINVNPDKPLFYISAIYKGEPNSSRFQLPASSFQLSSESELADIDANIISTDKLFIPNVDKPQPNRNN